MKNQVSGFSADAQTAMMQNPSYFVWWYTAKSMALVAAVAALAFVIGRNSKS